MTYRRLRSSRASHPTVYARALGLKHTRPGGVLCFVLLEGSLGMAVLMALAELVNWWAVILLPLTVAASVKINDLVAGVFSRTNVYRRGRTMVLRPVIWARGVAAVPVGDESPLLPGDADWVPPRPPSAVYGVSLARRNDDASVGVPVSLSSSRRRATNQRRFVAAAALRQPGRIAR